MGGLYAIVRLTVRLENDETFWCSPEAVGVFKTHEYAPRVLLANSNLVGHFSNWENSTNLSALGLMYGQMTAVRGSTWLAGNRARGTFETFLGGAEKHFGGSLEGKLIVSGGMGGMGGAPAPCATMAGASFLGNLMLTRSASRSASDRILRLHGQQSRRGRYGFSECRPQKEAVSVGLVGNCLT